MQPPSLCSMHSKLSVVSQRGLHPDQTRVLTLAGLTVTTAAPASLAVPAPAPGPGGAEEIGSAAFVPAPAPGPGGAEEIGSAAFVPAPAPGPSVSATTAVPTAGGASGAATAAPVSPGELHDRSMWQMGQSDSCLRVVKAQSVAPTAPLTDYMVTSSQ